MKSLKYVLILLMAFLVLPLSVFADGEEEEVTTTQTEESKEVNLYFFRGQGCSHCAEAEEWFESIEEEYGSYFEVVDYEVWYNEENNDLMQRVAEMRNETVEGVPYIIVGNKSWSGFTDDYKEEIISEIKTNFEKNVADRYDVIKLVNQNHVEKKSNDTLSLIIILVVVGVVGFGIYKARNNVNK